VCGIAGFQGGYSAGLLERMTAAVAHRGPDGCGTLLLEGDGAAAPTGLGHRRLSIIDPSTQGRQPMAAPCPRCRSAGVAELALTYNGEVYNFAELRHGLRAQGHVFHSGTDTEVLLHLYAEVGLAMPERLNGIFAFALRDETARARRPMSSP